MATTQDLDTLMCAFLSRGLPCCGLKVVQHGRIVYENYAGFSDPQSQTPLTRKSVFRMASMSKIPLYTALMMMYERGFFLMSDPIWTFLPEWRDLQKYEYDANGFVHTVPVRKPVTFRDVFSMKCGLPYCNSPVPTDNLTLRSMQACMKPLWEKGHFTLREHVRAMSDAVLAAEPGERWIYGFSSELAAALLEVLCDKPIDDIFREMLFEPLEMPDTGSRYFGDIEERMVRLYRLDDEGKRVPYDCPLDEKHSPGEEHEQGWGRLFSTVEDFSHLMQMLAEGGQYKGRRFLGTGTIDMMRANGLTPAQTAAYGSNPYEAGYGYGYGVRTLLCRGTGNHNGSPGSFGWTGGFGTFCEADPNDGVSIVYMHNMVPNDELYYHHRIRNAAYALMD